MHGVSKNWNTICTLCKSWLMSDWFQLTLKLYFHGEQTFLMYWSIIYKLEFINLIGFGVCLLNIKSVVIAFRVSHINNDNNNNNKS